MKEFTLPVSGGTARTDVLNEADYGDVLALQEIARAALPDDKKRFILPRENAYFQNLLAGATGQIVGIRAENRLIAQMAMMGPLTLREAMAMRAITYNDISFHHAALTDSIVVFKSMASHPAWRGNSLGCHLVTYAMDLPFTRVCDHTFAQVSVGNKRSWGVFAKHHYGIVAAAYDPTDGLPRFIFQKPNFGFDFAHQICADEVDPVVDFSAIISLTQREALIGIYDKGSTEKLCFMRNREALNLMPVIARVS